MINTNNKQININNAKIYITNDINYENIEYARTFFSNCTLYIDKKFNMPVNQSTNIGNSESTKFILEYANSLYGTTMGETQLNNLMTKLKFWSIDTFSQIIELLDKEQSNITIFIDNNVSKHEWLMISALFKLGVSFFIVSENQNFDKSYFNNKERLEVFDTNESLNYKNSGENDVQIINLKHLDEIEESIYTNTNNICLVVRGIENYENTCNFYGKLHNTCKLNKNFKLFIESLGPVSYEDSKSIPKIRMVDANYILQTAAMFIMCNERDKTILSDALKARFQNIIGTVTLQKLYNKVIHSVCKINEILRDNDLTHLVLYGNPSNTDMLILDILSSLQRLNIIVLISDKNTDLDFKSIHIVELPESMEFFDMPTVDRRNSVRTVAASVETRVNNELFNGDTLGMYKPGQFAVCETTRFTTTFDEIKLWWTKEVYIRPGFESNTGYAKVPNIFKVICGVGGKLDEPSLPITTQYVRYISQLITDKTFLFRRVESYNQMISGMTMGNDATRVLHGTDVNGTAFTDQLPFYSNGHIDKNRIKHGRNYKYNFLSGDKQDLILDNIEKIINNNYIDYTSYNMRKEDYIDTVFNTLLNLHVDILRTIQWFMFYNESPKLILVIPDEKPLGIQGLILMIFLSMLGFDVLVFVPTCYNTIETHVTSDFIYDRHIIGESSLNICVDSITKMDMVIYQSQENTQKQKKKKGFFSKLFN